MIWVRAARQARSSPRNSSSVPAPRPCCSGRPAAKRPLDGHTGHQRRAAVIGFRFQMGNGALYVGLLVEISGATSKQRSPGVGHAAAKISPWSMMRSCDSMRGRSPSSTAARCQG